MLNIYKINKNFEKIFEGVISNKKILSEGRYDNDADEFTPHGYYTVSNSGGYEIELHVSGDAARLRSFNGGQPVVTDWLEIEHVQIDDVDDEGDQESIPVIDPNGYNIPLNMVMRMHR